MPTVVVFFGIKIKVNARDHLPPHCHVEGNSGRARYNLKEMEWMDSEGFTRRDLERLEIAIKQNLNEIWEEWKSHHEE